MITLIVSATFVLLYNLFFFKTNFWGLGFGFLILLLNGCFFFVRRKGGSYLSLGIASSVVSIIFGLMVGWRANELVQMVNAFVALLMAVTGLYFYKLQGSFHFKIFEILSAPIETLLQLPTGLLGSENPGLVDSAVAPHHSHKNRSLINGIALTIPVVGVLAFFLIQADPIFGKLTQDFLSSIIERVIVSVVLFGTLLAFTRVSIIKNKNQIEEVSEEPHPGYEMLIVLGAVAVLFGLFIMVQFQYLFSKPDIARLQEIGIASLTYSEYVRKGFFELLIVASIVVGILSFVAHKLKKTAGRIRILIQTFSLVVVIQTGLILWSDLMRLKLYADENGLTRARIFGFIFLVFLTYLLIVMLVELMQKVNQKQLFTAIVPLSLVMIGSLTVVDVDGLIATRFKPTVNQEIDYMYITNLSADTYPVWKDAVIDARNTLSDLQTRQVLSGDDYRRLYYVRGTLKNIRYQMDDTKLKNWQAFNLGKDTANAYINDNREVFSQIDSLITQSDTLDQKVDNQTRMNTTLDRDITPPLVK